MFYNHVAKSEKYKHVSLHKNNRGDEKWVVRLNGIKGYYDTEREAAIAADKILIRNGKNPVNILKKAETKSTNL
jgi:hypothetical protein